MADSFNAKRKAGLVAGHGSGYGGSGFKFNVEEQDKVKQVCGQGEDERRVALQSVCHAML
jgi:hypothetical protein